MKAEKAIDQEGDNIRQFDKPVVYALISGGKIRHGTVPIAIGGVT